MEMNDTEMSILNGLTDALKFAEGKTDDAKVYNDEMIKAAQRAQEDINVRELRERLDLTQAQFAETFGVSCETLRNWEQGKRKPEGPAKVLLNVIAHDPKCVFEALRA